MAVKFKPVADAAAVAAKLVVAYTSYSEAPAGAAALVANNKLVDDDAADADVFVVKCVDGNGAAAAAECGRHVAAKYCRQVLPP